MSALRDQIGQLFLVGCQGESLNANERLLFEEYQFGGYILFKKNCGSAEQVSDLCHALWRLNESPPFIAIDQEGGRVHRLPPPFSHFPAAATIGAKNDVELTRRLGRAVADELRLLGVNLNFAPVFDVDSNPHNPIIGDRAFGATPDKVIKHAWAWLEGLRDGGIIPCGKHFPGHGDTDRDSHFTLPTVTRPLASLKHTELPPFAHACKSGIESLMTAHVRYSALDPKLPATLSEAVVTGLLRHQLGYEGVVFSDDLEMKAISANYSVAEATACAVQAGVDVLLFCHELEKAVEACEFLADEAERDPFIRAQIEKSWRRIAALKERRIKDFTGIDGKAISAQLVRLDHRRLIETVTCAPESP